MVDKSDVLPKTIGSPIVVDGLKAISILDDNPGSKGLYLVVGGTAVQSYLPEAYRRPTSDIDLSVGRPLNRAEFKEFAGPVFEYLQDHGYELSTEKRNSNFKVAVSRPKDRETLLLEFSRRNPQKYGQVGHRLQREIENGRRKTIDGTSLDYLAASPEDIVIPKLVRGIGTLERQPGVADELERVFNGEVDLNQVIRYVIEQQAIARGSTESGRPEESRIKSDLYDILCLSRFAGLNDTYLNRVGEEWLRISQESKELQFLTRLLSLKLAPTKDRTQGQLPLPIDS